MPRWVLAGRCHQRHVCPDIKRGSVMSVQRDEWVPNVMGTKSLNRFGHGTSVLDSIGNMGYALMEGATGGTLPQAPDADIAQGLVLNNKPQTFDM
jgi:hypothetical protein